MKKLMVMAIAMVTVVMATFATPVLASDEVDELLYYDADLDADVYYNAESGTKYYYDEGVQSNVTLVDDDDEEDGDDFAYVHDTLGVEVYYDEGTEEFYYYDKSGDRIVLINNEDDVNTSISNDWYNSDYSDLYQDEYQAAAYGLATVKTTCNLRNGQGTLLATVYAGEQVILLESIGRSGERTWVNYDGIEGSVLTSALVSSYSELTYDELTQNGGDWVLTQCSANLRDLEDGEVIATIPAGIGVQLIRRDYESGRYIVIWNGRCGSVMASAIIGDNDVIYYADEESDDDDDGDDSYATIYGEAIVKTEIGANMRNDKNRVICSIPQGETVLLLEEPVAGGRTRVSYGEYEGTVLTACLQITSDDNSHEDNCTCGCNCSVKK